jgi:predicted O-linked N-acetylglucosamine transferase (SPINDLY family)
VRKWLAGLFGGGPRNAQDLLAGAFARFDSGDWPGAVAALCRALEADPDNAEAWNRLGFAHKELGEMVEASRCFQRTVELAPQSVGAACNAASAQRDLGHVEEALALLRGARRLAPDDLDVLSAWLFTLNFSARASREEIYREHLECDRLLRSAAPRPPRRAPDGRLRIGYLSPDLRFHAVSCFVAPLLEHHDRSRFEIACYYLYPRHDATTGRLMSLADHWVDCAEMAPLELAARIRSDGVDVLVDLAGHTDWNALRALALRPAPVLATWLGYLNTTGLTAVDYRITDAISDPPGETERYHTEKLVRLPGSQWCREPPPEEPAVAPLPARRAGAVRFGSFNKAAKLTPESLGTWAAILAALPASELLFVGVEEAQREEIGRAFESRGIEARRLRFAGRVPLGEFRALHAEVDIALDSYPYSGATTTLDSLWMGVPVLTLAGQGPMSRSAASLLTTLGMNDWIATSRDRLVQAAVRHASDIDALAALRAALRGRLASSALMDGKRFTRELEAAYAWMWENTPSLP